MDRWILVLALPLWGGATLLLSRVTWFRVPPLVDRMRPYVTDGRVAGPRHGILSAGSIREVVVPLATTLGNRLARLVGVNDDLAARLARTDLGLDANAFRLRQAGWSLATLVVATLLAVVTGLPAPLACGVVLGAPALAFLLLEQQVASASARWQQRLALELPVVVEQLGMLLSSGYSLGAAVNRLGRRGRGVCARELAAVSARIRQGLSEMDALREWAARSDLAAVDRLVGVLALNWEAGDLGALIAAEARTVRREVQRAELELIEKRSQQVWVPVTVATLLPGVIFMAVPFVDAMGKLTGR
jgi:Flp pilus assembly protein TadB